jgi:hypothetical protein
MFSQKEKIRDLYGKVVLIEDLALLGVIKKKKKNQWSFFKEYKMLPTGTTLPLWGQAFLVIPLGKGSPGILGMESGGVAKHPTMHRALPTAKIHQV